MNNLTAKECKPYVKKLTHWFMLRKMGEFKNGVRCYMAYRCYRGVNDLELKGRLRKAASSILPCLSGDHRSCTFSYVCRDGVDPYLKCLPHSRNVPVVPKSVQIILRESLLDVFSATKLDALIRNSKIRTTSTVEAMHRTVRNAVPKNKPLHKNETPVLQMGATVAACRGKGKATLRHFSALGMAITTGQAAKLRRLDNLRHRKSEYRKTAQYRAKEAQRRRRRYLQHASALSSESRLGYKKEGFDHTYATSSPGEFNFNFCHVFPRRKNDNNKIQNQRMKKTVPLKSTHRDHRRVRKYTAGRCHDPNIVDPSNTHLGIGWLRDPQDGDGQVGCNV